MSKYYFNENPQVRHWMGKCAKLEQEIDILHEQLKASEVCLECWFKEIQELKERVEFFNALPWYKKIFFKFKI